ncbi:MAG TPA: corrinoid protein [Anaerolineales bacterium]|nr:corrinoid protein [Anaerolineales bacterium]
MESLIKEIHTAVMEGQSSIVQEKVQEALSAGVDASILLKDGMISAMAEVGHLFEEGECFVPEMLIAARAMQTGMALLKPSLQEAGAKSAGKVVIGTVKGDLHDIGKNLVAMMLEGAGFEIIDLGTDVAPEKFAAAVRDHSPQIVAMSALLTTTMLSMITTLTALREAGVREQVKVIIGGAPITEDYARQIGADGFSPDASRAVALAKSLISAN